MNQKQQIKKKKINKKTNAIDEKNSFRKNRLIFLGVLSAIVVILLVVLLVLIPQGQVRNAIRSSNEVEVIEQRELDLSLAYSSIPLEDKLLIPAAGELRLENYASNQIFVQAINMQRPVVVRLGKRALVADRNGHDLLLVDGSELAYEALIDGNFAGGDLAPDGHLLIIDEQAKDNAKVHLLATDGQRILSLGFAKTGNPIAVKFTSDSKFFDVLLLNSSSSRLKTIVRRYDLQGTLIGQRSIEGYNSLFFGLRHDGQDRPVIFSPTQVLKIVFDKDTPLVSQNFASILDVEPVGDDLYVFANTQSDSFYSIYKIDSNSSVSESSANVGRASQVSYVKSANSLFYVVNNVLTRFDLKNQTSHAVALDGEIFDYTVLANGKINLVNSNGGRIIRTP